MSSLFGATRPRELVAFLSLKMRTGEGPAYVFFAVDAFTQFAFQLGVESDDSPQTVLRKVFALTEDEDFKRFGEQQFTLVLDEYEELADRIQMIIASVNGRVVVNGSLCQEIAAEFLKSMDEFFGNRETRES